MKLILVIAWALFCALLAKGFFALYDLINHQDFRESSGDKTNQVGYEENDCGTLKKLDAFDECVDPDTPHAQGSGTTGMGTI